ncbi:uncharacterized protein LOC111381473 [Olea europaea var. sylvestris]|uniref:uncharacterized protein LOC111381473 n=1 Tax=Olea europaea var. sylvestris TaxID=158386 RepID=UPI000C1CFA59|nr:uncharacterized protein LOC111381473 [Olea europaea var. sylvestris]
MEQQYKKFLKVFKKLYINIPFVETLVQMPSYVKFLKDILSNKRKLGKHEMVMLTEECYVRIQKMIPPKLKDPKSFTLFCTICEVYFDNALCDLGASINLIPLSIFRKLGLGEAKATTVTLHLADRSLTHPRGIIEDVLIKVEKFIFPADFLILDMKEDKDISLILGDESTYRVSYFHIDMIENVVQDSFLLHNLSNAYEACISNFQSTHSDSAEMETCASFLDTNPTYTRIRYAYLGEYCTLSFIISNTVSEVEEEKLLRVLRKNKITIAWTIVDIKGISPSLCMHKILIEENFYPTIESQRRLNPNIKEVVGVEVLKILDAEIIYSISDSAWTNPVQVVPKKDGIMVVPNEKNELILTRIVTGWRMLERLVGHSHYCFLDGYLGYIQIPVAPDDQEKTTFTYPYEDSSRTFRNIKPLCNLLMKDVLFEFNEKCLIAFNTLKEKLMSTSIVGAPDWELSFELMCNASDHVVGAVLG